ncbi:phosphatase PAP2 family protein [Hylemonella gracilis]|uniref:PAP2 (Acid phosphatase) superfamily protein n=1 Tax=Hylemonella gracilis ATCC 19624 TaxID=887062 RepID=F3KQZ5_9BURK|nr:phosphatase PAP2 family protein [Hylemonella gracilis]EGI77696.1 PAP2 (acid phosphatase) superfamily protein [Hylemonella gracilis ATCC 19624]
MEFNGTRRLSRDLGLTLASLVLVLLWDALSYRYGWDTRLAEPWATREGFALKNHWLLSAALHDGARKLAALGVLALLLAIWRPFGVLKEISRRERVWLLITSVTAMLLVSTLKTFSASSCPWDMHSFGGPAHYISHWAWGLSDGGPGHCFPAGHASAGFAWIAGYFVLRPHAPLVAKRWLWAALAAGFILGFVQQLRGAHYLSHTLWSAWLCWTWAWLCSLLLPWPRQTETE